MTTSSIKQKYDKWSYVIKLNKIEISENFDEWPKYYVGLSPTYWINRKTKNINQLNFDECLKYFLDQRAGPVLTRTLTRTGWPPDIFLTRAIAYQLFGTNFLLSSRRRQKRALLILSNYQQYLHIILGSKYSCYF